jgi:ribosome biogenesis protein SSF1/2
MALLNRYNRAKDFITIAGHLGVSHLMLVSQTDTNVILRIARHPNGPTLHFRVNQFMLPKHVKAMQKRPYESHAAFQTPPVLVLNNFNQSDEQQVKLMKVTFQHLFPAINVKTVKLSDCRRVVLFHFNKENQTVEMRHYAIRANPVGISRGVKKILQAKLPDLGQLQDISEFVDGTYAGAASDSEAEDESSRVGFHSYLQP